MRIFKVSDGTNPLAIVVKCSSSNFAEGMKFVTDESDEFQLGFGFRQAGHTIKAHNHPENMRVTFKTSEVIIIQSGRMDVAYYDTGGNEIDSCSLGAGDILMHFDGIHEFFVKEDCRFIEIKQGPYILSKDKIWS